MVETNGKHKLILITVSLLAIALLWFVVSSKTGMSVVLSTFNPNIIWCADYDMACCGWTLLSERTYDSSINPPLYIICPLNVPYCKVSGISVTTGAQLYEGDYPCHTTQGACGFFGTCDIVTCENEKAISIPAGERSMSSGHAFYVKYLAGSVDEDIGGTIRELNVAFKNCGDGTCSTDNLGYLLGTEVPNTGSNNEPYPNTQCVMWSADVMYDEYGREKPAQTSYLADAGTCYWYWTGYYDACGTKDDQCNVNTDCGAFAYDGFGATCSNGALTLYECRDEEICIAYDDIGGTPKCTEYGTVGRCGVYRSNWQVGNCCPPDSCPTGQYCDAGTFSCVAEAECTFDWQCGTAVTCVGRTKYVPACEDGQCTDMILATGLDCCTNNDCAYGEYCDVNNECQIQWRPCPYECCVGMPYIYDKGCSIGEICCDDYTCSVGGVCDPTPAVCGDGSCEAGETYSNCPQDCDEPVPPETCGDGFCIPPNENCSNCPEDCGTCPPPITGVGSIIIIITVIVALVLAVLQWKGFIDIVGKLKELIP